MQVQVGFTSQAYFYPGGDDFEFSPENMRDLHLCYPGGGTSGSMEFQLPDLASLGYLPRISFRNLMALGTGHDVLLNPSGSQTIEGVNGTYRVSPGAGVTLQGVNVQGSFRWVRVL